MYMAFLCIHPQGKSTYNMYITRHKISTLFFSSHIWRSFPLHFSQIKTKPKNEPNTISSRVLPELAQQGGKIWPWPFSPLLQTQEKYHTFSQHNKTQSAFFFFSSSFLSFFFHPFQFWHIKRTTKKLYLVRIIARWLQRVYSQINLKVWLQNWALFWSRKRKVETVIIYSMYYLSQFVANALFRSVAAGRRYKEKCSN